MMKRPDSCRSILSGSYFMVVGASRCRYRISAQRSIVMSRGTLRRYGSYTGERSILVDMTWSFHPQSGSPGTVLAGSYQSGSMTTMSRCLITATVITAIIDADVCRVSVMEHEYMIVVDDDTGVIPHGQLGLHRPQGIRLAVAHDCRRQRHGIPS